ncbi:RagB/SusD family nutrient uptake outer membrane protein [Mucilaginibacter aquaedulcis]|uniref:RagB/SusD family nutrient uptake outer membrane protein n=1 Tax=Mucilaginibacter aquaedulcis TaxID=1187081 RepID=UPI0025B33538|nr:RagB/SusD family nutrient uptake outer membrane protein [Mucilaginibacter aquaedulcis]MDN3547294.1 RagB/SusD family nutrient uptake outer membrane protein [Mucilaginibacter aquaedulcis]
MKLHIRKTRYILSAISFLWVSSSCTKLNEKVYSDLYKDNFYKSKTEVLQAALRPVTHMQSWICPIRGDGYYYHAEMCADQLAWPQKGRNGYDNGDHMRQHYHTWNENESRMRNAWSGMWTGIGYCNSAIQDIEKIDYQSLGMTQAELNSVLAELHVLRAFNYMKVMDLWGNVPIITKVGIPQNPPTAPRKEVFEFIKGELETYVPQLQPYSQTLVGRVAQTGGYAMLAELYLNAEKWAGTPMWDQCIAACDKIMSGSAGGLGGTPKLSTDLLQTFANTNRTASEALFQYAYSNKGGFVWDWIVLMGYDNISAALDVNYSGNNGYVVVPSAFDAYAENDQRKKQWFLFGPQYKYGTITPVLGTDEYNGKPFAYVNTIRRESEGDHTSQGDMTKGEENSGARFNKYKTGRSNDPNYRENQFMIYRLTEIYFDKAEALMRKNNGKATAEAVDLVNTSRKRAFSDEDWKSAAYTVNTLTMDELLAERGREFIFEGKRRTDIIRFGKFINGTWWDHVATKDANKEIYPIPFTQLANNPNLKQNPGY